MTATRAIRQAEAIAAYKERQAYRAERDKNDSDGALLSPSSLSPDAGPLRPAAASDSPLPAVRKALELTPTNHIPAHAHHIPIIAVTASALEEDANRCMESGFDDIIHKPIILALLSQKMLQIRQHKRKRLEADSNKQKQRDDSAAAAAASATVGKDEMKEAPVVDPSRSASATI